MVAMARLSPLRTLCECSFVLATGASLSSLAPHLTMMESLDLSGSTRVAVRDIAIVHKAWPSLRHVDLSDIGRFSLLPLRERYCEREDLRRDLKRSKRSKRARRT